MPVYDYSAIDMKGKKTTGIIDAESAVAARQKLRSSNFYPVSITEVKDTGPKAVYRGLSVGHFFSRVKPSEVAIMTRQLATLIVAGLPLVTAFDTVIPQTRSNKFKKILSQIKDAIVEGKSFTDALSPYPHLFSSLYINMIHAGETSGTLEIVLDRLADIAEKQQALKSRIRSAMAYPIFMSIMGTIILLLLLTYIVPSITAIFLDMNQVLPAPTRFLIATSDFLKSYWWVILFCFIGIVVLLRRIIKKPKGRLIYDKIALYLPGIGELLMKFVVIRVTQTLGSLLENGVSMLPALNIVQNVAGNRLVSDAIEHASYGVEKGQGLGEALSESKLFPVLALQMIQVGEQSGQLESMLNKVADIFENEAESTIMSITALLQPVMILIMGAVVLFIVLSILLPIFEMNQIVF